MSARNPSAIAARLHAVIDGAIAAERSVGTAIYAGLRPPLHPEPDDPVAHRPALE